VLGYVAYEKSSFFALCNVLRVRGLIRETSGCSVEEQVAMFLHIVGHNQRFRVVHQAWRRSIETVSRVFHQVLYAVGEMRVEMIRPPVRNRMLVA
jgi:predicted chitinase